MEPAVSGKTNSALIVQGEPDNLETLRAILAELGHEVRAASSLAEANAQARLEQPDVLILDIGLLGDNWPRVVHQLAKRLPGTRVLPTSAAASSASASRVGGAAAWRVLHPPFTRQSVELAFLIQGSPVRRRSDDRPTRVQRQVLLPALALRTKITLPYVLLAVFLALAGAYLVTRILLDSVEERFTNQLIEVGRISSEWMVLEEDRLLKTLRLLANTDGMAEALAAGDSDRLRELIYPVAVNEGEEVVEVLDAQGVNLLSLRHRPGGNPEDYDVGYGNELLREWGFVRNVLEARADEFGDKFAGVVVMPSGSTFYVAGPVRDGQGGVAGAILIGRSLSGIAREMREATLAQITLYGFDGVPLTTTLLQPAPSLSLPSVGEVVLAQDGDSLIRPLTVANIAYQEILGTWQARDGHMLGLLGVSLPQTFLVSASRITRLQIFGFVTFALVIVIVVGVSVSDRVTRPLLRVIRSSAHLTATDLRLPATPKGNDEVTLLAESFSTLQAALKQSREDVLEAWDDTLTGWAKILEFRDDDAEGHTRSLAETTVSLARSLGVDESELIHIRRGAMLHDIGKIAIPDRILFKPGPLTQEEWAVMRRHPIIAHEMLSGIAYLRAALDIPRSHHERWDGSGYPFGLKGEEIPLAARIFAVVDVWDALSSDRPFRRAWAREAVLSYLRENAGTHFEPRVVEVFLGLIEATDPESDARSMPAFATSERE